MPLVCAAIAPHGFPLIPLLGEDADGAMKTRLAMLEMGRRFAEAGVEAVVIAGPHGFRVNGTICLADVARGAGALTWNGATVEMNVPVDGPLTDAIATAAEAAGVPIAMGGYAGNRRDQSVLPLDWGVLTPLWFVGHDQNVAGSGDVLANEPEKSGPPVVIASPSRSLPREAMVAFGRAIADAASADGRRIGFIASCDWAHRHIASGPYGFHEAAKRVDARVVDAVESNDLLSLFDLSDEDASDAAIDGLWQTLMLGGALQRQPMSVDLLSYEAPGYYGMLVATYRPE